MDKAKTRRCAIYTRKSTEEGLEQEFNSLDAQRESCAAFILSQAHEGWENLPELYDDGGYSGGSMKRPGLTQLMSDVQAGKIDVIVVYKVDRLTRSLADFAKIVEVLDDTGASFVSVTQAFNTTSSMGRLTLNVLLSFAQFEREVTSERIRDKFAASKKKGMWMGGAVPHGLRVEERKLLINEDEANQVRYMFQRYTELKSVPQLVIELKAAGYRTRSRQQKSGRTIGNVAFGRGALAGILKNPVYAGKIVHYENIYDGEHKAIIDQALFEEVQAITKSNCYDAMLGTRSANPSLLTGMLVDPDGKAMSPVQARKKDRRYRYYATRVDLIEPAGSAWRTSAGPIEKIVVEQTAQALGNPDLANSDDAGLQDQVDKAQQLATKLRSSGIIVQRGILLDLNVKISIAEHELKLSFECPTTRAMRQHDIDAKLLRKGNNIRILPERSGMTADNSADAGLLELIAKAFAARQHLFEAESSALVASFSKRHLVRLARLSCLSPDIIDAILSGRQPAAMTARSLLRVGTLPLCWTEQKAQLGFA
jgi:DNA invertase Pin-like site-specific DNA recombinase